MIEPWLAIDSNTTPQNAIRKLSSASIAFKGRAIVADALRGLCPTLVFSII